MFQFLVLALAFSSSANADKLTAAERKQFIQECDEFKYDMDGENLDCACLIDEIEKDEEVQDQIYILESFEPYDGMPKKAKAVIEKCTKK